MGCSIAGKVAGKAVSGLPALRWKDGAAEEGTTGRRRSITNFDGPQPFARQTTTKGRYHLLPRRIEDDYILEDDHVLGKGYNGQVIRATGRKNRRHYAVKSFDLQRACRQKVARLRAECEIFVIMDHPHIARLVDVYETPCRLDLVMECMTGGELFDRIAQMKRFSEGDTARAVIQMLLAVSYLHSHNVVHRDLKLQNFLYEAESSDHLKLIDFGFSEKARPNTTMKAFVGTLAYMAPEILCFRARYTSQCDLWSLGVITFVLLVGRMPFYGTEAEQMQMIKAGNYRTVEPGARANKWNALSAQAKEFVAKLLTVDPKARMTATEALRHPFLSDRQSIIGRCESTDLATMEALEIFSKSSQLRRAIMEVMAWSLTSEEQAQVRDIFEGMDINGCGTITFAELRTAVQGVSDVSDDMITTIFSTLDASKDEEIHYSEFLAAMVSTRIQMHDDLLYTTFLRFDADHSGYITVENLKEVIGDSFDGVPAEELLLEADFKNDRRISYEEFIRYLKGGRVRQSLRMGAARAIDEELEAEPRRTITGASGFMGLPSTPGSRAARQLEGQRCTSREELIAGAASPASWWHRAITNCACTRGLAMFASAKA